MAALIKACPHCKANLVGKPIPDESREHFGGATHFNRLIAHTTERDRAANYVCPDCQKAITRAQAYE